jgi:formylglycine-generating enzyme required for sulfatase activity/tRNA A-37 threonylcarbamoyl transferase component Bud32
MPVPTRETPMPADHPHAPEPARSGHDAEPGRPADTPTQTPPGGTVTGPGGRPGSAGTLAGSAEAEARAAALSASGVPAAGRWVAVPGYEVEAEIARGGMGVVYKARHVRLNRPTALKMILGGRHQDPTARVRFLIEAEAVAALDHPHVVPVYEFGEHDGLPFLAMEFVGGGTLAQSLDREGRPAPRAAAVMVAKLAGAVAAAHAKGVVHRDLKPSNVLLTEAGEPKLTDFGLAKVGDSGVSVSGAIMGTPSYMAPEQAAGRTREVGTPADVYSLGAILYELLTGRPPFLEESPAATIHQVLSREPDRPRAVEPTVPRDLETVCLKCLEKGPHKRYATAEALGADLRAFLDGRPIVARPVGAMERAWKWARRHPERAAGIAAALLLVAGVAVAAGVIRDRQAAEVRRKERETRAAALVEALAAADTVGVPRLLDDLTEYSDLTGPGLRELVARPVDTRPGLHGRLALLADEPGRAAELAEYLPTCRPGELLTLRDLLKPHAIAVGPGLWATLADGAAKPGQRVRAAAALAGLTPHDVRWSGVAPGLAREVVEEPSLDAVVVWRQALEPVRDHLLPPLMNEYQASLARIRSGKLGDSDLVAEVLAFDLTANLLARYATDRPAELAELAVTLDARHYPRFADAIGRNKPAVVPLLRAELGKGALPGWAGAGETGPAVAAVVGAPAVGDVLDADAVIDARAKRRGYAAAALLTLGEAEAVWPVFRFPADGDPGPRGYLLARLAAVGADSLALLRRFGAEADVSAQRALVIALGDFPSRGGPVAEQEAFVSRLLALYRGHPDSGLHSAIDWLLRQKWGKAAEVAAIDAGLAAAAQARVVARGLADAAPVPVRVGPLLRAPAVAVGTDWFVNAEGQTFAVVRGPVEFVMGSPATEPGRIDANEPPHPKRIGRTFAIATREVTVEQFLKFQPGHDWVRRYSPGPDTPAVSVSWYDCAAYCNWLSEREGIPPDQWCYLPNKEGQYAEGMRMKAGHLQLTGYRLPTEAEWEYSCRAGAVTARYYGRGEELLPRYGWFVRTADDRAWPGGRLRPNDRGLFDALGNPMEWVEDPALLDAPGQRDDTENSKLMLVDERTSRLLRGGSFFSQPVLVRCANRSNYRPGFRFISFGCRPARTLP